MLSNRRLGTILIFFWYCRPCLVSCFTPWLRRQPIQSSVTRSNTVLPLNSKQSNDDSNGESSVSSSSSSTSLSSSWQSFVSDKSDAMEALKDLMEKLPLCDKNNNSNDGTTNSRAGHSPELAILFVSQYHAMQFDALVRKASRQLGSTCRLVSVVGAGVIGDDQEMDEPSKPSMSLLVGYHLSSSQKSRSDQEDCVESIEIFDFNELQKPPPEPSSDYWKYLGRNDNCNNRDKDSGASVLLFADPWSPVEQVIAGLGPKAVVAGGISVPTGVGPTVAKDDQPLPQGSLVGICFKNDLHLQVVTAQGCRPVNEQSFTITSAEGSCILELDSQPAIKVLEKVVGSISDPNEQKIVSSGLVCGIQALPLNQRNGKDDENDDKNAKNMGEDDYLIRQILGFVPTKGGLLVAGGVHVGDRLRFHVRDKKSAQQDLELMMKRAQTERSVYGTKGKLVCALQISCVARGRGLYGDSNVDLEQTRSLLGAGEGPVAGFYANGEIGPVGIAGFTKGASGASTSHIHGFTTVVAYLSDTSNVPKEVDSKSLIPSSPLVDEPAAWG